MEPGIAERRAFRERRRDGSRDGDAFGEARSDLEPDHVDPSCFVTHDRVDRRFAACRGTSGPRGKARGEP